MGAQPMGSSRYGELKRWGVHEMGSTRDGILKDGNSRDVEFSRWEIHEIGSL